MIHDQDLVDRLSELPTKPFKGKVFRATGVSIDPTAPSINGGRWSPAPDGDPGIYVLYTSLERDGAIAEMCAFLSELTPIPKPRPIKITRLALTTSRILRLARGDLTALGVDMSRYGERDYGRTQKIGAALSFLGLDGLIAPSARWPCDNLMVFMENHALTEQLEPNGEEQVEWRSWAEQHGILPPGK
jgi:RES domain